MTDTLPSTSRSLPIALMRARESVMQPIREMLADTGLTEQQWRVLRVLAEHGPQDATVLAERACLLMPSLTRILRRMEETGMISRRPDASDRRRQEIAIAEAGRQIIDDNAAQGAAIVAGFRARLGDARYEQLLDFLEALSARGD